MDLSRGRVLRHPGSDYSGFDQARYGPGAVAELERCHKAGARGVGELSDKGRGLGSRTNTFGMHLDDPRLDPLLEKCAELHLPVNIHVGEDKWMYEPMDRSNDGLMNAWKWRVLNAPGVLQHDVRTFRLRVHSYFIIESHLMRGRQSGVLPPLPKGSEAALS
jgi:uncharacterized protein